jgi:hypothetical protein
MNERTCRVPRCGHPAASAYSHYCRRHKSTLRRQGATQQTSIRKSELRPYLKAVSDRVARNPDSPLWPELERIWDGIASDARATSERRVGNRYERSAAREVLNIAADAAPHDIVRTALAMFIMWRDKPGRFSTDAAFRMQLARRVRALSSRHRGSVYDHSTGRQRPIYREMTPKAGAILGHRLALGFGLAGLQLAELEARERQAKEKTRTTIIEAIRELK